MNKYTKYVIEFVVFMIIFIFVDKRQGQDVNWIMNTIYSCIVIVAQMMLDKRRV